MENICQDFNLSYFFGKHKNMNNQNTPFFSIIIPVYNVEAYIARCLDSCVSQSYSNIEIIVVDDCGSDNSIAIAQEYAQRDNRIKIIHNSKNLGLFHTRIEGEKQAKGKYILHVDSDDFIKLETCEILHQKIQSDYQSTKEWCDFCCFGMEFYPKDLIKQKPLSPIHSLNQKQILETFFLKPQTPSWTIWNKAYKNTLICQVNSFITNNLYKIPHITMAEDVLKFFVITLFAKKSIGVKNELYYYCQSFASITRTTNQKIRQKKIRDLKNTLLTLKKIKNFSKEYYMSISLRKTLNILNSTIKLEARYENKSFAYPIACIKSLKYHQKWQTYMRIFLFFVSFGKIKI